MILKFFKKFFIKDQTPETKAPATETGFEDYRLGQWLSDDYRLTSYWDLPKGRSLYVRHVDISIRRSGEFLLLAEAKGRSAQSEEYNVFIRRYSDDNSFEVTLTSKQVEEILSRRIYNEQKSHLLISKVLVL